MAQGFLGGALLGGVVSLGAAGVASVIAPLNVPVQTASPQVSDTAPDAGATPEAVAAIAREQGVSTPTAVTQDKPIGGQSAPRTTAPEADSLTDLSVTSAPAAKAPVTGDATELAAPADIAQAGGVDLSQEDPVLPNPQALAPMMPEGSDAVAIDTTPAARPVPKVTEIAPVSEEMADEIVADALAKAMNPDSQEDAGQSGVQEATDQADVDVAAADVSEAETPVDVADQTDVTEEAAAPETEAPEAEATPEIVQTEIAPVDPPAAVVPEGRDTEENEADTSQVAMLAPSARPQIGTPAISLTDRDNGVVVNRLGNSGAGTAIDKIEKVTIITDGPSGGDLRPITQYAQPFANAENKPLMSIILIDDGSNPTSGAPGIAALRSFPYTLSFAVDSALPDAAERVALYREEGFEVLAMVDLPQGALASDVETTLGVTLSQMREVVGVLEGTREGVQSTREVADQVTAILAQSGHGLVTQDKGLNTMPKLARKDGVPADPVFRDFDSAGQTATVIRRFLDQAAFKAGQEGAVVMLGRLRPDTISALLLWGLQDRAGKVALAPISAVLTREDG
ncbi:divergent polysaccharide deacetylase family protein [Sulfitobacter geojensis]|uniref:divergent polysaccharide deacetylase family protein n=1 Tax=Sulfitobacter geojensis TaxID=1342299 RepID=UPI003B8D5998